VAVTDPERVMVRRALPFGPPAIAVAFFAGLAIGGWNDAWSAGIGATVVLLNFAANGLSLAWAAKVSLTAYAAVVMGGFIVRLGIVVAIMAILNRFAFFSPLAFGLAVVPATILLLAFEMKVVAGPLGRELVLPAEKKHGELVP
jgi:hypothetical protein